MSSRVCLLSGGVGGAKLALGLYTVLQPEQLTIIANTGDDIDIFGLRVCPDSDILIYTLAGEVDTSKGWGLAGETFRALERVRLLGGPAWFNLGDLDLGLHLLRAQLLREGVGLAEITQRVAERLGLRCRVLPMCEQAVPTYVHTDAGRLHLQEYLVRERAQPRVTCIEHEHMAQAQPAPGVVKALADADLIVLAPSNPLISIGPILAVPGLREALGASRAFKVAVSPVVGGASLKGPTDKMLRELGHEVTPAAVARLYADLLDAYVIDAQDAAGREAVEELGLTCHVMPTVMSDLAAKQNLARALLAFL